jgi:hypothetical protein
MPVCISTVEMASRCASDGGSPAAMFVLFTNRCGGRRRRPRVGDRVGDRIGMWRRVLVVLVAAAVVYVDPGSMLVAGWLTAALRGIQGTWV